MRPTPTAVGQSLSARIQVKTYPFNSILWQTEVPDRFWDPRRELKVFCSCHSIARARPRSVVGEYSYDPAKRERRMSVKVTNKPGVASRLWLSGFRFGTGLKTRFIL